MKSTSRTERVVPLLRGEATWSAQRRRVGQHVSVVMHDLEAFEASFELVGEAVVRLGGGDKQRVAARLHGEVSAVGEAFPVNSSRR